MCTQTVNKLTMLNWLVMRYSMILISLRKKGISQWYPVCQPIHALTLIWVAVWELECAHKHGKHTKISKCEVLLSVWQHTWVAIIATPFNTCMNVSKIGLGCLFSEYHHYFPIKDVAHNYFEMLSSLFSATSVSCNHAFVRHPHCNLDSFFLLECFYLFLV